MPTLRLLRGERSIRPVDVGHQVLVFGVDLFVHHLDDVADGDDADEAVLVEDGSLGDPASLI